MASIVVDSTTSQNYITQVSVGGTAYDIVPYHGITFKEGNSGTGVKYDGKSEVTVVIPTVADLLQNPLQFIGTIDANGTLNFVSGAGEPYKPSYLAYFSANCAKFNTNRAICVGVNENGTPQWKVVSGENQVSITNPNTTVNLTTTGKNVLTVEGKNLTLGIKPVTSKVNSEGSVTVPTKTIYLKKGSKC